MSANPMSSIQLTLKLFRHNLKATASYLATLILAVAMYYNFALLKYSPEVLGGHSDSQTVTVCAWLMSIVMVVVFFAFVWSSSRFFLTQRKKEIGLYALCGVPMRRAGRVFLWDSLLTGLCALAGGLVMGMLLTKLFLMGAAMMIKLEAPMAFTWSAPALGETLAVVGGIFVLVAARNSLTVRRSKLIDLLQGMRVAETPPKRRALLALLSVAALAGGYGLSVYVSAPERMNMILFTCIPVLLLVILGSYWAFEALLPAVLERATRNKRFFYRGARMVGISNLWYRLRANYRNLALTSVLSATALTTLCVALTMSDYVGAREGKYAQRLIKTYSLSVWMDPEDASWVQKVLGESGVEPEQEFWIPMTGVTFSLGNENTKILMAVEKSQALEAAARLMPSVNLPAPDIQIPEGSALRVTDPDWLREFFAGDPPLTLPDGRELPLIETGDLWFWGGDKTLREALIVPDGWLQSVPAEPGKQRMFLGLQVDDELAATLHEKINVSETSAHAVLSKRLTTQARMLYGTLSYLGLIMFGVFSLLTGCALLFKQLSEAAADRLKYQSMIHVGATRSEIRRAVGWQVGLSLVVPILLGFAHAAFAVRLMGMVFVLPTAAYLLISACVYGVFVLLLYLLTLHRFMRVVAA